MDAARWRADLQRPHVHLGLCILVCYKFIYVCAMVVAKPILWRTLCCRLPRSCRNLGPQCQAEVVLRIPTIGLSARNPSSPCSFGTQSPSLFALTTCMTWPFAPCTICPLVIGLHALVLAVCGFQHCSCEDAVSLLFAGGQEHTPSLSAAAAAPVRNAELGPQCQAEVVLRIPAMGRH